MSVQGCVKYICEQRGITYKTESHALELDRRRELAIIEALENGEDIDYESLGVNLLETPNF